MQQIQGLQDECAAGFDEHANTAPDVMSSEKRGRTPRGFSKAKEGGVNGSFDQNKGAKMRELEARQVIEGVAVAAEG